MLGSHVRDTFGLLLREHLQAPTALSANAERAIRTRVTTRWVAQAAGGIAAVSVAALAVT
jgi:hypothetical protein